MLYMNADIYFLIDFQTKVGSGLFKVEDNVSRYMLLMGNYSCIICEH